MGQAATTLWVVMMSFWEAFSLLIVAFFLFKNPFERIFSGNKEEQEKEKQRIELLKKELKYYKVIGLMPSGEEVYEEDDNKYFYIDEEYKKTYIYHSGCGDNVFYYDDEQMSSSVEIRDIVNNKVRL